VGDVETKTDSWEAYADCKCKNKILSISWISKNLLVAICETKWKYHVVRTFLTPAFLFHNKSALQSVIKLEDNVAQYPFSKNVVVANNSVCVPGANNVIYYLGNGSLQRGQLFTWKGYL